MFCELVLAVAALLPADTRPAGAFPFQVIVHRENPVAAISRAELSAVFMKRNPRWRHGPEVVPVDQQPTSAVREAFSAGVHETSVAFVIRYWHRVLFSGRGVPPAIVRRDSDVIDFVAQRRGAIGYVSATATIPTDVKVIAVTR